jgi:hypothetical protein
VSNVKCVPALRRVRVKIKMNTAVLLSAGFIKRGSPLKKREPLLKAERAPENGLI